ncbi:regulator of G-protein signaling protein-like isoform X2 [Scyliorhinus torazame]|uniref:regulator of G-protein signaling protein-like isoform X2 n=1 Tax=Scyliorhinus torazame TaxID=75743 RepID=UPI003B5CB007
MGESGRPNFQELLKNDIFVDFLNTFLSLPRSNVTGFIKWLEEYRLPHFLQTDLYLHFVLCELLLDAEIPEIPESHINAVESTGSVSILQFSEDSESSESRSSKRDVNETEVNEQGSPMGAHKVMPPDRWVLRRCLGSVRGMKNFRSFLAGTHGAELVEFWVRMARMLKLDETNVDQRDQYFTQLRMIQAIHLQDGSVVMATCSGFIDIPSLEPAESYRTRRDFMVKLHERVFEKLKTYWLPRFLTHCQYSLKRVKVCSLILHEYQVQGSQKKITKSHGRLKMSIKQTKGVTLPYFTKASKRLLWNLPYCKGKSTMKRPQLSGILKAKEERECPWSQSKAVRAPKPPVSSLPGSSTLGCLSSYSRWACCSSATKDKWAADTAHIPDEYVFPQSDSSTPLIKAPSMLTCWRSSEMPQQSQYLHWAFNADQLAGEPFATFLRVNNYLSKLNYLHLWHEMNNFFRVVLSTKDRAGYHLRIILAEKIIDLYLKEGSKQYAQLQAETARNLKLVLPSGNVLPWIFTAQREIFEILRVMYDEFLDKEDEKFLNLVGGAKPNDPKSWTQCERRAPSGTATYDLHLRRMARSLILAQACSVLGDTETLTEEDWKMLAQEDIAYLGSMQILIEPAAKDIGYWTQPPLSEQRETESPVPVTGDTVATF